MFAVFLLVFAAMAQGGESKTQSPLADIGLAPEVALTDAQNRPFTLSRLRGKVVVVSFIYTTCNGVCPATTHNLYRVQQALREAGLWGREVEFVSITLDPERDTAEVLARYAEIYDCDPAAWHFLTGTPAQIQAVLSAWDMWARRDDQGVLDHPSRIFLLDPQGHRREIYNLEWLHPKTILADVRGLLAESAARDGAASSR